MLALKKGYFSQDLTFALQRWRFWTFSAFLNFRNEHRKSRLGILWEIVSLAFVSAALTLVWAQVLGKEPNFIYFSYVFYGLGIWQLISRLVDRGASTFTRNAHLLNSRKLSLTVLALEESTLCLFRFLSVLPFLILVSCFFSGASILNLILFSLSIMMICLTGLFFSLSFGVFSFFFQDLLHITNSIMRIGFLVTPIIWEVSRLGANQHLIYLNPFFPFLDLSRSLLMGRSVADETLYFAGFIFLFMWLLAISAITLFGEKLKRASHQ